MLVSEGTLLIKLWFHLSKKAQRKRLKELRKELEAKGVQFNGDTFDTGVCHMALFTDPDGNDLMLHHRYAD